MKSEEWRVKSEEWRQKSSINGEDKLNKHVQNTDHFALRKECKHSVRIQKGVMKPRDPKEKGTTGGTGPLNMDAACI